MSALAKLVLEIDRRWADKRPVTLQLDRAEWARLVDLAREEPDDDSEAAFLDAAAKGCDSCSCCRQVPCEGCQAGGVCDALECIHDDLDPRDVDSDDEADAEAP